MGNILINFGIFFMDLGNVYTPMGPILNVVNPPPPSKKLLFFGGDMLKDIDFFNIFQGYVKYY